MITTWVPCHRSAISEEARHRFDDLLVALTARKGVANVACTLGFEEVDGSAVERRNGNHVLLGRMTISLQGDVA